MFKTMLNVRTGGFVNVKEQTGKDGGKYYSYTMTGFVRDSGSEMRVLLVGNTKKLDFIKHLMIANDNPESNAKFKSRYLLVDGRLSIKKTVKEVQVSGETYNGQPIFVNAEVDTVCVFIDKFDYLDASPANVESKGPAVDREGELPAWMKVKRAAVSDVEGMNSAEGVENPFEEGKEEEGKDEEVVAPETGRARRSME